MKDFYAHGVERKPVDEWHVLEDHEGTVPDLRTERSGVVESGLSPAKELREWVYLAWLRRELNNTIFK